MSAIVIDLKDFEVRSPEQVVRVFLSLYGSDRVEVALWEVFIRCAGKDEKGDVLPEEQLARMAELFDHLVALTRALHALREDTPGRCVLCGRLPVDGG